MTDEIVPRYEFRAFAQTFGRVAERIRNIAPCENIRESKEIYVLAQDNDENNTKIRYGTLDVKTFVTEKEGLEQWKPRLKADFPIPSDVVEDAIFPALGIAILDLAWPEYTLKQFLDEIVNPHPKLSTAYVFKRRFHFMVNGCMTEIGELLVNGAAIRTVAVEAEDVTAVLQAKEMLGLQMYENVNYLLALKRIMGLAPLPAGYWKMEIGGDDGAGN